MTIDGGFLDAIAAIPGYDGVIRVDHGKTHLAAHADGVVFEMNEWMAGLPRQREGEHWSGNQLMQYLRAAYYGPFVEHVKLQRKRGDTTLRYLVFVADDYRNVPKRKGAVHVKRQQGRKERLRKLAVEQSAVDALEFSDQAIPHVDYIRCSSSLLYKGLTYVAERIHAELAMVEGLAVYVSMPSLRGAHQKDGFGSGSRCSKVSAWDIGGLDDELQLPQPPVWQQGEGEVLARLYAMWIRKQLTPHVREPIIVIGSCDYDNIPMTFALPEKESRGLFIRIRRSKDKQRRYISCEDLVHAVNNLVGERGSNGPRPDGEDEAAPWLLCVAFGCILRSSDYCAGFHGLGAKAYWNAIVEAASERLVFLRSADQGRRLLVDEDGLRRFLAKVRHATFFINVCDPRTDDVVKQALWNLRYWMQIEHPQPGDLAAADPLPSAPPPPPPPPSPSPAELMEVVIVDD